jgi:hypothetical protein
MLPAVLPSLVEDASRLETQEGGVYSSVTLDPDCAGELVMGGAFEVTGPRARDLPPAPYH